MKEKTLTIATVLFVLIGFSIPSLAHDNEYVHPGLAAVAKDLLVNTEIGYDEVDEFFAQLGECDDIEEGSVKEDMGYSPEHTLPPIVMDPSWNLEVWGANGCEVERFSYLQHAYNPINGNGWHYIGALGNALDKGVNEFEEALDEYADNDKERAYFQLGRVVHLLEDMTSPAHVHSDIHVPPIGPWADEAGDFEEWGVDNYSTYAFGTQVCQPAELTTTGFFDEVAFSTYYASSFQGVLYQSEQNPVDPTCELAQMFPSQITYTLISPWGYNYWEIENIGEYEAELANDDWWECEDDGGYFYIENSGGEDGNGVFPARIRSDITDRYSALIDNTDDKELHVLWAEALFPLTVDCTAGLLKYFYDAVSYPITLTMTPPADTNVAPGDIFGPIEHAVTNNTEAYYSFLGERYVIEPNGTHHYLPVVTDGVAAEGTIYRTRYLHIPTGAEPGKYTWVAKGWDSGGTVLLDSNSVEFTVAASSKVEGSASQQNIIRKLKELLDTPGAQIEETNGWQVITLPANRQ